MSRTKEAEEGEQEQEEPDRPEPLAHALAQAGFNLRYIAPKWTWNLSLDGRWEPKETDSERLGFHKKLEYVEKTVKASPLSLGARMGSTWSPSRGRTYDAWVRYQYRHDEGDNETTSLTLFSGSSTQDGFSYYHEEPMMEEHTVSLGGGTRHEFGSARRVLLSSFSVERKLNWKYNQWLVFKTDQLIEEGPENEREAVSWIYRITPRNNDLNFTAQVHFRDSLLRGPADIVLDPGIRFYTQHDTDLNSGATLDLDELSRSQQEVWRDSLRIRERFDFLTFRAEPYVAGDLAWKKLRVHIDYGLQLYGRRLNGDEHWQPMKMRKVYPLGNGSVSWQVGEKHRLSLDNTLSVSHPDYFKVCWYERTGGYLNQLYRGNEELLSTCTRKYGLGYDFKTGRFLARTNVSMTRKVNEIDQTWTNEEIEGRMYRVFTWINAADSWTFGASQRLDWEGQILSANLVLGYNQTLRTVRETGAAKKTFDWNLSAGAAVHPGDGWDIGADIRYQSKIETFFALFDQYCVLNARVQKRFRTVSLFLEGRDLLDNERTTSFSSADHVEIWEETVRANRRLFILGLTWNF